MKSNQSSGYFNPNNILFRGINHFRPGAAFTGSTIPSKTLYRNGTYLVKLDDDGTKEFIGEVFESDFPDSIDVKITNNCNYGCPFCHESSIPGGKNCDTEKLLEKLGQLPDGVELALGGGNVLLHPDIKLITDELRKKFIVNITLSENDYINEKSKKTMQEIYQNINAVGKSVTNSCNRKVETLRYFDIEFSTMVKTEVIHTIIGVIQPDQFEYICESSPKVLLLGFKQFGRGEKITIDKLDEWKKVVRKIKYQMNTKYSNLTLSFDNLALEQLDLKSAFLKKDWDRFYLGDEFTHSMYLDAVNGEYAPTSRSPKSERVSWDGLDIITYFKNNHVRNTN